MRTRLAHYQPLLWIVPALLATFAVDHVVDDIFGAHVASQQTRKGRTQRSDIDDNKARVVVIGDSSGRYAVNAELMGEELGVDVRNAATFLDAFPGHVAMLIDLMREGHQLDAIVIVSTEQMADRRRSRMRPAMRQYYASPTALRLWWGHEGFDLDESLDFAAAIVSPTYRSGQRLQNWLLTTWRQPFGAARQSLAKQRQDNKEWFAEYRATHGQSRGDKRRRRVSGDVKRLHRALFARKKPWQLHPSVQGWYEDLVVEANDHQTLVVHAFAPRIDRFLQHKKWASIYGDPIRAWGRSMSERHDNFLLAYPQRFRVRDDELFNTDSHVIASAADRFTLGLLEQMAPALGIGAKESWSADDVTGAVDGDTSERDVLSTGDEAQAHDAR